MSSNDVKTAFTFLGPVESVRREGNVLNVFCKSEKLVKVYVLDNNIIRVRFDPKGAYSVDDSYVIVKKEWPETNFYLRDNKDYWEIETAELKVRLFKEKFRLSFYNKNNKLVNEDYEKYSIGWDEKSDKVKCCKSLFADEHFYGFGEKADRLDKRRKKLVMWNTDAFGYSFGSDPLYLSVPFFIGLRKGEAYGIFFDNSYRTTFDMGFSSEEYYSFEADGGELNYYFIYGPLIKKVLKSYSELTGKPFLPPKWSLGYQQSRYSYYPEDKVLEIAKKFRELNIPCDVLYLDIHYMDNYKVFTWDKERFPDPKGFLDSLSKLGFKVITIVNPGIKADSNYNAFREGVLNDYFCKYSNNEIYFGKVWPGTCAFPDFTKEEVRNWWGNNHKILVDVGVKGIWNDMNEPSVFSSSNKTMDLEVVHFDNGKLSPHSKVHNLYGFLMSKATYEGLLKINSNERPFVLSRSGFAGIQRYAAIWTGDNTSSWEHLYLQVPMLLSLGLSGIPFIGADVGGFAGNTEMELLIRWYQVSMFMPLFRNHTSIGTTDQEPWNFGYYALDVIREIIKLRYTFLPLMYTLVKESHDTGLPVVRPLLLEFQDDENTYCIDDEFLLGSSILVAPIVKQGINRRLIYLPMGNWYDFWTNKEISGPRYIEYEVPLNKIPIFVKHGSVIPVQDSTEYIKDEDLSNLTLNIYISNERFNFELYEDDGHTFNYLSGDFKVTKVFFTPKENEIELFVVQEGKTKATSKRKFSVRLIGVHSPPKKIETNGKKIRSIKRSEELKIGFWFYDSMRNTVEIPLEEKERINIKVFF
ncbi:MAG: glycoside hydrolase family 31 protein [Thermoproteota archaeon]|nr:glycoside hydrolase family 31 protein [Candidatus Brockarchaeota archaeon]